MEIDPLPHQYHSYLLRLWQIKKNDDRSWRASLEDTQTGELIGFANLGALVDYLEMFRNVGQVNPPDSR